jgi:hypothetical protein
VGVALVGICRPALRGRENTPAASVTLSAEKRGDIGECRGADKDDVIAGAA